MIVNFRAHEVPKTAMELQDLHFTLKAAETLSFRRAALVLDVKASSLSRRVRRLEDEIGVSLFERISSGVRLTMAGTDFVYSVRALLGDLDNAIRRASQAGIGQQGAVRIGLLGSLASHFPRNLLERYLGEHPGVRLDITEGAPGESLSGLADRRLDVAFIVGVPQTVGLEIEQIWSERVFVALPERHELTRKVVIDWDSLRLEQFIVSREEPGPEIHDYLVRYLANLGHHASISTFDVGREALMNLVGLGLGISLMSEAGVAVSYPGVVFLPLDTGEALPFNVVWRADNDNPALRRLLSLARVLQKERAGIDDR